MFSFYCFSFWYPILLQPFVPYRLSSQAVMSSDIAIAQFRYLERLLLVHGHWCYRRMSSMVLPLIYGSEPYINVCFERWSGLKPSVFILTCSFFFWQICYFFYKNITFGFTLFLYEVRASFSGEPAYNDWFLSLYSILFTSLPVIALGVLDQDVSARYCLKVSLLFTI